MNGVTTWNQSVQGSWRTSGTKLREVEGGVSTDSDGFDAWSSTGVSLCVNSI